MAKMKSLLVPALAALAACGEAPPPAPATPSPTPPARVAQKPPAQPTAEAFRKSPPAPGPEVQFVPPKIEEARLPNGVRVLLVERHELPIVAVEIVTDRGADQGGPALGAFVGAMLTQGTKARSSLEFSDAMGRIGAQFSSGVGHDGGGVSGQALAPRFGELLALIGDAYMRPAFAKPEVERERSRRLNLLAQMNDQPSALLSIAIGRALYPEAHPYHAPLLGTEAALGRVAPADLQRFHAAHYQPDHTTVAIAGDVRRDQALQEVERVFGGWKGKAKPAKAPEPPPQAAAGARVVLVDRAGLTQSMVAVALPGVARVTPDYEALLVMNTLLGGQFTSRLNLNLREKHAYTYGARSSFDMRHGPGPFTAGGAIVRENTGPAVKEILAEIRRMREELVTAEELDDAKANLIQRLPAQFETAGATASTLAGLAIYGLPLDEYATRPAKIRAVTREDVQRVAQKYLTQDRLKLVLVADAAKVQAQLEPLGLGAVDLQATPAATPAKAPAGKTP